MPSLLSYRRWLRFSRPRGALTTAHRRRGLRGLFADGVLSQCMDVLVAGAFLPAFALLMGASAWQIGLLATLSPITQLLQVPAVRWVEKLGRRKLLAASTTLVSRAFIVPIAALPLVFGLNWSFWPMVALLLGYYAFASVAGCAFNGWVRDLIPVRLMGRYFSSRMSASLAAGAVVSLLVGIGVDLALIPLPKSFAWVPYSAVFLLAALFGFASLGAMLVMPEPKMKRRFPEPWHQMIRRPLRHAPFRSALIFLLAWSFVINLAGPFYAVYVLKTLEYPLALLVTLGVLSQLITVATLPAWGRAADRFGNRAMLMTAAPLFALSMLIWPLTTMPQAWFLTLPLLLVAYVVRSLGAAGTSLGMNNLAMSRAPREDAAAFLAVSELTVGIGGIVGPIVGGVLATLFAHYEVHLDLVAGRVGDQHEFSDPLIYLRGLDLLFVITFAAAVIAIVILGRLKEDAPPHAHNAVLDDVRTGIEQTLADLPANSRRAVRDALDAARHTARTVRARFPHGLDSSSGWTGTLADGFAHYAGHAADASLSVVDKLPSRDDVHDATRRHLWPTLVWLVTGVDLHRKRRHQVLGKRAYRQARDRVRQQTRRESIDEENFDIS
ncbi:MAG: MFS transporter [Planctomycetota bacterium]